MSRRTRRHFLLGAGAAAAATVAVQALLVEPNRLHVSRHRLRSPSPNGTRVRVVQLTDLHLHQVGRRERRVAARTNALRPDLLAITGDAVETTAGLPALERFLALLDPAVPKLAVVGNWELKTDVPLDALGAVYAEHHGRLLRNASETIELRGARLLVTGLDDHTAGRPDVVRALRDHEPTANHLLLAHSPRQRDVLSATLRVPAAAAEPAHGARDAAAFSPVAMLSGHTHGGQVAPLGIALVRPTGSGRYVTGWYHDPGRIPMYVSPGFGTSLLPVRLGATPEIAVFDWDVA